MGANNSKLPVCSYCATEIIPPKSSNPKSTKKKQEKQIPSNTNDFYSSGDDEKASQSSPDSSLSLILQLPPNTLACSRCHGYYKFKAAANTAPKSLKSDSSCSSIKSTIGSKRYIEHLHIAPFADTLQYVEEKQMDEEYIINTYLRPYFDKYDNILIRAPYRLNIKNVEFKVLGCYPPKGYIYDETQFHLNGNDGKLITLRFEPIKQIHLLPTKSSLNTYKKINGILDDDKDNKNNDESNEDILRFSLRPYLKRNDKSLYINDKQKKKTVNDEEDDNENEDDSRFYLSDKTLFGDAEDSENNKEEKKNDNEDGNKNKNKDKDKDKKEDKRLKRHLIEQETFISNNICWRVMKCIPNNGYIDRNTEIFCNGKPIEDSKKIIIRPIYETIPFSHRNFTPTQIKRYYLNPFFRGTSRYIDHSRQVKIYGVDFSIRECQPNAGLITLSTKIDYMGAAIKAQELENMQKMEDEEMAQKIQKQMEEENNRRIAREQRRNIINRRNGSTLRGRWEDPLGFDFPGFDLNFPWTQQQPPPKPKRGVDMELVERLPTFKYKQNTNNQDNQCRICLEYYNIDDDLRILPCFHFYHKQCVDTWLTRMSTKCPICNTSIIRQHRQRQQQQQQQ